MNIEITNNTNHAIVLPGRTLLGRLQLVQSVTPVEVKVKEPASNAQPKGGQVSGTNEPDETLIEELVGIPTEIPSQIKDIDLEGLTPAQKETALRANVSKGRESPDRTKKSNSILFCQKIPLGG